MIINLAPFTVLQSDKFQRVLNINGMIVFGETKILQATVC